MKTEEIIAIQKQLGLSDGKMAEILGITRQSWRNWRTGRKCPIFAQNALIWMMELRRLSPANDNLPAKIRSVAGVVIAIMLLAGMEIDLAA